jgi:hypothetical protein
VKQLLTSVVREIRTLRSVGAGARATVPGHPVAPGNWCPYRDRQPSEYQSRVYFGLSEN